jgi:hypothetical protein
MGLDSFARRSPEDDGDLSAEDVDAFGAAGIELCGGVVSGSDGSFRGKVYFWLVLGVTGEDLYEEWIPPDRVRRMYEAFRDFDPESYDGDYDERFGDIEEQARNLREFFRVCAERGLGIEAFW